MSLLRRTLPCLVLFAAWPAGAEPHLVQFTADEAKAAWKVRKVKDGVTLEYRTIPGSSYHEYRVVVDVATSPERAAGRVWEAVRGGDMDSLKHRDILRASEDELLIYDQIRTPIVSDRDYTITVRRVFDPALRRTQFRCATANELGPPVARGHVRIPIIRAGWMTEPSARGGTRLTYYAYSEPGGLVAAFLVRGAQADRAIADVLRMRRRLEAPSAK